MGGASCLGPRLLLDPSEELPQLDLYRHLPLPRLPRGLVDLVVVPLQELLQRAIPPPMAVILPPEPLQFPVPKGGRLLAPPSP